MGEARLDSLLERIWPGRAAVAERLVGGITNNNFKVQVDGEAFVLRIGGRDTDLLGIDRPTERAAAEMASGLGVGPEVVAFLEDEGCLVTRFIEGRPVPPGEMRRPHMLAQAAEALRAIHTARTIPGRFDAHRVVEAYGDTARARGGAVPERFAASKAVADRIEWARRGHAVVPCHNDLLNANFIHDGRRLRIVDWEYAGMGDPVFDLANFSINHELDLDQDRELLASYGAGAGGTELGGLRLMRFMSDFREAMWGVVQTVISALDFDFESYAAKHFDRMEATAADPEFDHWLDLAAAHRNSAQLG